ncbi:metal ABC transporter solute-binding protein, Zn/Mn family [Fusibacter sp. JL298sf-3]
MKRILLALTLVAVLAITGCTQTQPETTASGLTVVATTTMLADLSRVIGGEHITVEALMGPGIDPHLYNASAGDVDKMTNADMVVYNGLHLEGKMGEIFENLKGGEKIVVEIADGLSSTTLVADTATGAHDPHIWFDVMLWKEASANLLSGLIELDPENESTYRANYDAYAKELDALDAYVRERIESLEPTARVLVTAHDAFAYFGAAYDFEVVGLQGISTESEAGTADVSALADFIVKRQIKAVFVESSVPKKNIEALQEAVQAKGFDVEIGGELYSDSLGTKGTDAETYIGTVRANVDTIVGALE